MPLGSAAVHFDAKIDIATVAIANQWQRVRRGKPGERDRPLACVGGAAMRRIGSRLDCCLVIQMPLEEAARGLDRVALLNCARAKMVTQSLPQNLPGLIVAAHGDHCCKRRNARPKAGPRERTVAAGRMASA
jgi:hypothetical protein